MSPYPSAKIATAFSSASTAAVAKDKGKFFEEAASLCLCSIPGIEVVHANVSDDANSMEIDAVLYNQKSPDGLQFLEHHILVECKNWTNPVDSKAMRDFAGKIRAAHLTEGIIVAANGITGNAADVTSAHEVIRNAFVQDRVKVFILTKLNIETFKTVDDVVNHFRVMFTRIILRKAIF